MTTFNHLAVFERRESNARGYCRSFPKLFSKAKGSHMWDADGNRYIDFLAGCGGLNYGHNDDDMKSALLDYIGGDGMAMGLDLHSEAKLGFISAFERNILNPRGLDYRLQFTGPTGANGIESALKLARKITGRTNVIAFTNGFHGVTSGALAVTGNGYNRVSPAIPLGGVTRMPFDGYCGDDFDTASLLETMLADPSGGVDAPAAIVLETVQGEGGLNVASAKWLQRIARIAKQHGALFIIDDVQAGCGRTGQFFSFEGMGVEPDVVVLSKSLSGFGLPMAMVMISPELDQWGPAEHNGTFRGNSHAFVTSRVAIEKFWSDTAFSSKIGERAALVTERLAAMAEHVPGSRLKGRGMMQGLDVRRGELASAITSRCFERGLIIETAGPKDEVVKILAALTTPMDVLNEGLDIVEDSIHQVTMNASMAAE